MKKNNLLTIVTIIFFIIIIFTILFLKKVTIFDYQAITCNINNKEIETVISKKQLDNITKNKFFYYQGSKHIYKIIENIEKDDLVYLILSTNKKLSKNKVGNIYIPIKKISLLKRFCEKEKLILLLRNISVLFFHTKISNLRKQSPQRVFGA